MPEVVVKYKTEKALQVLTDFAKHFDIEIVSPGQAKTSKKSPVKNVPIDFAAEPDFMASAGIWKGRNITLADLRKKAWGGRLYIR